MHLLRYKKTCIRPASNTATLPIFSLIAYCICKLLLRRPKQNIELFYKSALNLTFALSLEMIHTKDEKIRPLASEMTSFTSRWRMRAHPAGGVAEDVSARAMTTGLVFPIMYPLLAALQACADINASTTLRHDNENRQRIS